MKCEECQPLLEEFFDGELNEKSAAGVAVHVKTCSMCAALLHVLTAEQETYRGYEREVQVPPTAWLQIEKRISKVSSHQGAHQVSTASLSMSERLRNLFSAPRLSMPVAAGLVLTAVVLTIAIMNYSEPVDPPNAPAVATQNQPATSGDNPKDSQVPDKVITAPVVKQPAKIIALADQANASRPKRQSIAKSSISERSPAQLVREAEEKYLAAIALLTRDVESQAPSIDTQARAKFESALAAIDRTISATRVAVKQNPNDPVAVQYMLAAYRKKVDVLREMTSY